MASRHLTSFDVEDGTLKLWDIVSARVPTLEEPLDRIDPAFEDVQVHFSPDRLDSDLFPVPDSGEDGVLMVRGPYPPEGQPFELPVIARC